MFAANIPALHSSHATTSYYSKSSKPKKERQLWRFENFLCCFQLETGGLVIGWTSVILSTLAAIVFLLALLCLPMLTCDKLQDLYETLRDMFSVSSKDDACFKVKFASVILMLIGLALCIVFAIIAAFCISGTLNRNYHRVKPLVILLAIASFLGFLNILFFTASKIIFGLICGCIFLYFFFCIYSLFYKLKEEFKRGLNVKYRPPVNKV